MKSDLPPGGLLPLHHEAAVEPVNSNQLVMGALLDDLAVIDNEYFVGVVHGFSRWAIMMTVLSWVNSAMASMSSFSFYGSTLAVASSRMMTGASFMMVRAMDIRWRSPPESVAPPSPMTVSKPSGSAMINS